MADVLDNFCKHDISRDILKLKLNQTFVFLCHFLLMCLITKNGTRFSTRTRTIETLRYPFLVYGYGFVSRTLYS